MYVILGGINEAGPPLPLLAWLLKGGLRQLLLPLPTGEFHLYGTTINIQGGIQSPCRTPQVLCRLDRTTPSNMHPLRSADTYVKHLLKMSNSCEFSKNFKR